MIYIEELLRYKKLPPEEERFHVFKANVRSENRFVFYWNKNSSVNSLYIGEGFVN